VIVLDASVWVSLVGAEEDGLDVGQIVVPAHFDAQVLHALRGLVRSARLDRETAEAAVTILAQDAALRVPLAELLEATWPLADAVSAYDAFYVALARREGVPLLTRDARLARGAAELCEVRLL